MTTPPRADQDDPTTSPASSRGYGWADRAGRQRHTGTGTRQEGQRHEAEEDGRHGAAARHPSGTTTRQHGSGTPERHSGKAQRHDTGTTQRHDDDRAATAVPDRHQIVVPVAGDRAVDGAGIDGTDDDDNEERVPRRPLLHNLRFVNESLGSLRELLRFAREAHYNLSHIPLVRAFHIVFFWLVTAPVLTIVLALLWAFVARLFRALTATVLTLVLAPAARTIPVVGGLVPEWLVVTTWSATTWRWVGVALLGFAVGTAIVLVGERRR